MSTTRAQLASTKLETQSARVREDSAVGQSFIKRLFELYCAVIFKTYCPITATGREHIPNSPFIFCSNHNSHMDSAVLMAASRKGFQHFGMVAARDYFFDNRKRGSFLNHFMALIPIDRKCNRKTMKAYLSATTEFVSNGQRSLIVYPEGTRSKTGELLPMKKGPAIVCVELGLPIVPAYIDGTYRSWPKGRAFMKPQKIRVAIGQPIVAERYEHQASGKRGYNFKAYRRVTQELERRIRELMVKIRDAK